MKVTVRGDAPMERLANVARPVVAAAKEEIDRLDKKWENRKKRSRKEEIA